MSKSDMISVRLDPEQKLYLEERAHQMGIKLPDLLRKGGRFYAHFDDSFLSKVLRISARLNIPSFLVIQNEIIRVWAEDDATREVFESEPSILKEFLFTSEGVITGDELYNILKADKIRELENQKDKILNEKVQYGIPLSEEEKAWRENRNEQFKRAMETQAQAKKSRDEGLVASYSEGEDEKEVIAEMKKKREAMKKK